MKIYLDNNATTRVDPAVIFAMQKSLEECFGNPSSMHHFGRLARSALNASRKSISSFFGVLEQEIIFTSGGTESMNLLIRGLLAARPGAVITSNVEHSCVFETLKLFPDVTYLPAGRLGCVTLEALQAATRPDTTLIVLMAVNNETGVKTDIDAIAAFAKSKGIAFVVDGIAAVGKESFKLHSGITGFGAAAHKFHGPKGVGLVFLRKGTKIVPQITGGQHEGARRAGTENIAGIVGMAKALSLVAEKLDESTSKMSELRDRFEAKLSKALSVRINGEGKRVCNVSNLQFPGVEGEALLQLLDRKGVAVSHGSACASGALEPSRVLLSMGLTKEEAVSSLRFSLSRETTEEEIDRAVQIIIECVS